MGDSLVTIGALTLAMLVTVLCIMAMAAMRFIYTAQEKRVKYLEEERTQYRIENHERQNQLTHRINELFLLHADCQRREARLQAELDHAKRNQ